MNAHTHTHTHSLRTHIYIHFYVFIYIYIYLLTQKYIERKKEERKKERIIGGNNGSWEFCSNHPTTFKILSLSYENSLYCTSNNTSQIYLLNW